MTAFCLSEFKSESKHTLIHTPSPLTSLRIGRVAREVLASFKPVVFLNSS